MRHGSAALPGQWPKLLCRDLWPRWLRKRRLALAERPTPGAYLVSTMLTAPRTTSLLAATTALVLPQHDPRNLRRISKM